eukprot:scaffold172446_cov23-Tisochrysis_lutea.AAC.3
MGPGLPASLTAKRLNARKKEMPTAHSTIAAFSCRANSMQALQVLRVCFFPGFCWHVCTWCLPSFLFLRFLY